MEVRLDDSVGIFEWASCIFVGVALPECLLTHRRGLPMRHLGLNKGTLARSIGELLKHIACLLVLLRTLVCVAIHFLL